MLFLYTTHFPPPVLVCASSPELRFGLSFSVYFGFVSWPFFCFCFWLGERKLLLLLLPPPHLAARMQTAAAGQTGPDRSAWPAAAAVAILLRAENQILVWLGSSCACVCVCISVCVCVLVGRRATSRKWALWPRLGCRLARDWDRDWDCSEARPGQSSFGPTPLLHFARGKRSLERFLCVCLAVPPSSTSADVRRFVRMSFY